MMKENVPEPGVAKTPAGGVQFMLLAGTRLDGYRIVVRCNHDPVLFHDVSVVFTEPGWRKVLCARSWRRTSFWFPVDNPVSGLKATAIHQGTRIVMSLAAGNSGLRIIV